MIFRRLPLLLCLAVALCAVSFAAAKEPLSQSAPDPDKYFNPADYAPVPRLFVIAHQGWSSKYPSNTLLSYAGTIEAGADSCEIDIHRTKDGEFVMMHDGNTLRTTGVDRKISDSTFEELRKLDAGAKKGKRFQGTRIPTFDESMTLLTRHNCPSLVEIKSSRPFPFEETAQAVIDRIKKDGWLDKVIMNSFSQKEVRAIRQLEPNICVAWNYSPKGPFANATELVDNVTVKLKAADTNVILLRETFITKEAMDLFHERGIHILAWFGVKPERMQQLIDAGVDGIITDDPDVLRGLVGPKK